MRAHPFSPLAVLGERTLGRWLASELLANAAWAGTLVYAGALFAESYGTSPGLTGGLLALAAVAYVAGNVAGRRLVRGEARPLLAWLAASQAVTGCLLGTVRPGLAVSATLLSATALLAGGRTLVTSAFALSVPAHLRPAATGLRTGLERVWGWMERHG